MNPEIKARLEQARDRLAEEFASYSYRMEPYQEPHASTSYSSGFDACLELVMPAIEALEKFKLGEINLNRLGEVDIDYFLAESDRLRDIITEGERVKSKLLDDIEFQKKELAKEKQAAAHWMSEACRDHNALMKLRDAMKAIDDKLFKGQSYWLNNGKDPYSLGQLDAFNEMRKFVSQLWNRAKGGK